MRVSIVTSSFNQGQFLEQTIQSVLNQNNGNVEYILIDGGSTDDSPAVIRKYSESLAYWQSQPDKGAADAINQGWKRSSGEILGFLNSDDVLAEDAIGTIVSAFQQHLDRDVIYGDTVLVDASGTSIKKFPSEDFDLRKIFTTWIDPIRQPSAFLRRRIWERFGGLDETYQFCFDFEYWIRISAEAKFLHIPKTLSFTRTHVAAKSVSQEDLQARELIRIFDTYKNTSVFQNLGLREADARKGLYFNVAEHFLNAGKHWEALRAQVRYCRLAFAPLEAAYRMLRYMMRILLRPGRTQ